MSLKSQCCRPQLVERGLSWQTAEVCGSQLSCSHLLLCGDLTKASFSQETCIDKPRIRPEPKHRDKGGLCFLQHLWEKGLIIQMSAIHIYICYIHMYAHIYVVVVEKHSFLTSLSSCNWTFLRNVSLAAKARHPFWPGNMEGSFRHLPSAALVLCAALANSLGPLGSQVGPCSLDILLPYSRPAREGMPGHACLTSAPSQ